MFQHMYRSAPSSLLTLFLIGTAQLGTTLPTSSEEDAAATRTIQLRDSAPDSNVVDNVVAAAAMGNAKSKGFGSNKNGQCSLSKASMPVASGAPSSLPSPSGTLAYVAIGRGTQNYTCDPSKPQETPTAAGAVANLYDSSCIAGKIPFLLSLMPTIALQFPTPSSPSDQLVDMDLIGHHYFTDATSPVFNFDTATGNLGYINAKSGSKVPAPSGAPIGQNNQGFGAVPWLSLAPKDGPQGQSGQQTFKSVYRVNTAGGNPPSTCQNMPSNFKVDYAAEYWFYK